MKMLMVMEANPGKERLAQSAAPFTRLGLLLWTMLLPAFSSSALTTLYSFTNGFDGAQPYAGLTLGSDGNFYGTCFAGGTNDLGSVFKISPAGVLTPLYSFAFIDGETPTAGLTLGNDGNFYGTTFEGGTNQDYGTVFQISSNGAFNSLYSFANGSDGANPYGGLVQGGNGAFYGTTVSGGSNNNGAIFEITTSGALTPLYSFTNGVDGSQPRARLTLASDGTFYGTTYSGGSDGQGVVFHLTAAGALTPLHSLNGASDGANPVGQLTFGTNGILYGTAYAGGANGDGTVFEMTKFGAFSVIYSFTGGSDGANPAAGLTLGSDGNYYGTTYGGGPNGDGGIFKITPQGVLTPLYLFTGGDDGAASFAMLAPGNDGALYGTTQYGGSDGDGVVFKIVSNATGPMFTSIAEVSGTIQFTWSALPGQTYQAQYLTDLTQTNWNNLGNPVTATNGIASQTDRAPRGPQRFYRVYLVP
jgi:uncharacterized repeat protein (TIGR03803 family)